VVQDVRNFRSVFGLPARDPMITLNGSDPGTSSVDDETENVSDVEWAGAIATGATIDLIVSKTTTATDGGDLSAEYAVDKNVAPVVSSSYGRCESGAVSLGQTQFYNNLWEQAAAQGITVTVASGDGGSALCDESEDYATYGLQVNSIASTAYDVAVGGTDFSDVFGQTQTRYWSSTNNSSTLASATTYIPEMTWNDSCASPQMVSFYETLYGSSTAEALCNNSQAQFLLTVTGGSGGASSLYSKPSWQNGVNGIPADGKRDVPDVSLFAGDGMWLHAYPFCQADNGGPCNASTAGGMVVGSAGGDSFGAPAFAGIMALVDQKKGGRQGLANTQLYKLAASEYGSASSPNTAQLQACSASVAQGSSNTCVFYDVTAGNNDVPCQKGSTNCYLASSKDTYGLLSTSGSSLATAYSAGTGYDLATGLGSVNVANLVNQWNASALSASKTHTGSFTEGQTNAVYTVTVSNGASAAPTNGTVTVTENPPSGLTVVSMAGAGWSCAASACTRSDVLNAGASYPAIAVTVNVALSAPSQLTNQVTVSGGGSASATARDSTSIAARIPTPTTTTLAANPTSISSTASTTLTATVTADSGNGTPTGTVTFNLGGTALGSATLAGAGGAAQATLVASGSSQLAVGGNSITANYGGDANYSGSSSPAATVTVTGSAIAAPGYTIGTVAGNGTGGFSGDGGQAISAELYFPAGVTVDSAGNLFIADAVNSRIRKVTPEGTIGTVAGNGTLGFTGDGGPATAAELNVPIGVAVDSAGNLYIADTENNVVRKVTPGGTIGTVAGNGTPGYSGDGGPATAAELDEPSGLAIDGAGNLYIADDTSVRKVTPAGTISTVAGTGIEGYSGDGGPGTLAELNEPGDVAVDSAGNLYIADFRNQRIRKVTPAGTIGTVAGNGAAGFGGDGGPATSAELWGPTGVAVDGAGDIFIADRNNTRIRMVTPAGTIGTVAGNGTAGFSGDGGPATLAEMQEPGAIALDGAGDLFIADAQANRIRKATPAWPLPSLTVSKTHSGTFSPGQTGAQYTVTVGNAASSGPTSGTVTVTENPPTGLTVVSMAGTGWSCTASACSRSDVLNPGANYPAITVTANVASGSPSQLTNQVTVSGGGSATVTASDLANIIQPAAIPTTTTLAANPAGISTAASTTLTATVAAAGGSGTPTGTVTFYLGSTPLGSAQVSAAGAGLGAVLIVNGSQLALGANSITASYGGDANFASSSASATVTVVSPASAPTITAVENGASYQTGFAPAAWVSILGRNLSQTTRTWGASDFVNGLLPVSLSGVSVTIDGQPAYVYYISPAQINVLAPDDSAVGAVEVQVTVAQVASNSFTAQKVQFAPGLFTMGGGYVAALHADYSFVGKSGLIAGATSTPATAGETISIYGTGFGPANPPLPSSQVVATPAPLANSVLFTIGGAAATVTYAGVAGSGLDQFNVKVPNVPNGDAVVVAQIGGVETQTGVLITVQSPLPATPAPQIASLNPATGPPGSTVTLTIAGSNLSSVTSAEFSPSAGITVSNVKATATQVTATVNIAAGAAAGQVSFSVSVWPSAGISNALVFTIPAAAQIASLSPTGGSQGSVVSLTIAGSNLSSVTGVAFSPSTGITVSNVSAAAAQVTATVSIAASAPTGQAGVTVSSPAGASNSLAFTILPNYAGQWLGTTSQSQAVSLTVAGGDVTAYSYGLNFSSLGSNCATGSTITSAPATSIPITGSTFTTSTISGTFLSATQVSGAINWTLSTSGCNGSGSVTWSAVKQ
jgi:uncharacterized protein (TIGR03437 family)